jgi:hypothetical protein
MNSYHRNLAKPSDIQEHLGLLHGLAMECWRQVVELGFRTGVSTSAFLAAGAKVTSYDIDREGCRPHVQELAKEYPITFTWKHGDSREVEIPECDLLFLDSAHTYATTKVELFKHCDRVRDRIVLHDVVTFGRRDRNGDGPGIMTAVDEFLRDQPWRVELFLMNNNGLCVLERVP